MNREQQIQDLIAVDLKFELDSVSGRGAQHYTITLSTFYGERDFTYFQGSGITEDPSLESVLYCLVLDARAAQVENAREFRDEYGYDSLEKARETLLACKEQTAKLSFLGIADHLEQLEEIFQDY